MFQISAALFTLGLGCLVLGSICAEYTESYHGIQSLLDVEAVLVNQLELYLAKAEKERDQIIGYLEHVDNLSDSMDDPEEFFGNPINAFTTISRFENNWKHEIFDVLLDNDSFQQYEQNITNELNNLNLERPTNSDLLSASSELWDFQENFNYDTSELANEVLFADEVTGENVTLSANDCFVIGRSLCPLQQYGLATEWLLQARQRAYRDAAQFPIVSQLQILEQLVPALQELGSYKLANKLNNEILKTEATHEAALKNKIVLEQKLVLERIRF